MKHVKQNPHIVFEEVVDFRSAKGKFSKPHRAAYALITFPRKRKPYILDLVWLGRRSNSATISYVRDFLVEYYKEIAAAEFIKEEAFREEKKPTARGKIPSKLTYKLKKTKTIIYSVRREAHFKILGYNYTLSKPLVLDFVTSKKILSRLNKDIKKLASSLYTKNKYKNHLFQVKYFCGGLYERAPAAGKIGKVDTLGFSKDKFLLHDQQGLKSFVDGTSELFLHKLLGEINKPGYLGLKVETILGANGKPLLNKNGKKRYKQSDSGEFLIYGFRIEFSKKVM